MKTTQSTLMAAAIALALNGVSMGATAQDREFSASPEPEYLQGYKPKIRRLSSGDLVVVYGDTGNSVNFVYDLKADKERPARDLYVQYSSDDGATWSEPQNISQSANRSSIATDWRATGEQLSYYGDTGKPNIFSVGKQVLVVFEDTYCPISIQDSTLGGKNEQRTRTYTERLDRELPFKCVYAARSKDGGVTWATEKLTTGKRDALQTSARGSYAGWGITWQEDPTGLEIGAAEGPGDGASGANVSNGTDIWYSFLSNAEFNIFLPGIDDRLNNRYFLHRFSANAHRLTQNWTKQLSVQGETLDVESGIEGAARPNIQMVGETAVVAYEETKGIGLRGSGKVIRYHQFPYEQPPTSTARLTDYPDMPDPDDPARVGCIISDPDENARRVRILFQNKTGKSGLKLAFLWRQGEFDQGGPADIFSRLGYADSGSGLAPGDLVPHVEGTCDRTPAGFEINNDPAINLSHETTGDQATSAADMASISSSDNRLENALAHRGFMRGDSIVVGYTYSEDWAVAGFTDMDTYDFFVRSSVDGGMNWSTSANLSKESREQLAGELGVEPTQVNIREPRLVATPGSSPKCASDPSFCQDTNTFFAAWGTQDNVYQHIGGADDIDIFVTRSTDFGGTYEPVRNVGAMDAADYESQLQTNPSGEKAHMVWSQEDDAGSTVKYTTYE